jgi:hypothetical protein
MCFFPKSKTQAPITPAAAPEAPKASPVQQDIGGARVDENLNLFGKTTGPKTRRSTNTAGTTSPTGSAGLKM